MKMVEMFKSFAREEDGVALTEYLVLLGLLLAGVIVTVGLAGTSLNNAWANWQSFWDGIPAPSAA
ncbi:Flp family type IVb pilin [Roseibium sp.]|uniref:Flp family type IVb pilin n=1 Tax=Roseibium sp. TaxID=1936156 RepID=UPI003D0A70B6